MNVDVPDSGCNIIQSDNLLYNYSNNNRTRTEYTIYEGQLYKRAETTNNVGYTISGTCVNDGDIVYQPVLKVWFPIISFLVFFGIVRFVFRLFRGRM